MEAIEYQRAVRERLAPFDPLLSDRVLALEVRWAVVLPTLATKESVEQLRGELRTDMERVRVETRDEIGKLRSEMHQSMTKLERWLIGTMISFGVAAIGLTGYTTAQMSAMKALVTSSISQRSDAASPQTARDPAPPRGSTRQATALP